MKKTKQKRNKQSDNAKLAEKIHTAKKEAKESKAAKEKKAKKKTEVLAPLESIAIPESTRDIKDILADHVTVLDGHIGLKLSDDTPIEESLRVLDWTTALSEHVGFMIGDVINFGHKKWTREKYQLALNQTGRAYSTLTKYASVSAAIPAEKRKTALSFSAHVEIAKLADVGKIEEVLDKAVQQAEKGEAPTVKELRIKVTKLTPRKKKAPKKATSGKKGKAKKAKPEPPPYEPSPEEQAKMDIAEDALKEVNAAIKDGEVEKLILKCDNGEKRRWTETLLLPVFELYQTVERYTGY
jgi:hypothetical protein